MNEDPLAVSIERALRAGWHLIPQVAQGVCDNALLRVGDGWADVVTIPTLGSSTVVRLLGGPVRPDHPRRPGRDQWRHWVPVDVAIDWLLTGAGDDRALHVWSQR